MTSNDHGPPRSLEVNMYVELLDLVKFVICTLVARVHMTLNILMKWYTVTGNQGTYDKLNQIRIAL